MPGTAVYIVKNCIEYMDIILHNFELFVFKIRFEGLILRIFLTAFCGFINVHADVGAKNETVRFKIKTAQKKQVSARSDCKNHKN